MTDLDTAKQTARRHARTKRRGLDSVAAGLALCQHLQPEIPPDAIVAGYWPMGDEIDIRHLLHALHERHHPVALPATPPKGQPLTFHRWHPNAPMLPERFGTIRPIGDVLIPCVLLIPLLAFDRTGARLGYGGGYYDRTLAELPHSLKIGCAFAEQEVDSVPVGPYDIRLDAIATDQGIIRCGA